MCPAAQSPDYIGPPKHGTNEGLNHPDHIVQTIHESLRDSHLEIRVACSLWPGTLYTIITLCFESQKLDNEINL